MEALYKIRLEIDGLMQLIYIESKVSQRTYEVYRSLRLSKAWTTKIIKILNPEENSSDILNVKALDSYKNVTNIQFNLLSVIDGETPWEPKSTLEKIDFLIQEIDRLIDQLPSYIHWLQEIVESMDYQLSTITPQLPKWGLEINQVYIHLTEVKMFLGFELLNMKQ